LTQAWLVTPAAAERDQRRAAAALRQRHGLAEGDRIALIVDNSPAALAVILGALRTGIVPVMLHPGLLPAERQVLLDDADPQLVVDDANALDALVDHDHHAGEVDLFDVPKARPMHYTSGTSGRPKGVWSGILGDDDAHALFHDEARIWRFDGTDTTLVCSPLYHSVAVRFSATTLLSNGNVILLERFDAAAVKDALQAHRPTAGFMVPAHLQRLFAAGLTPDDVASFRLLVHAGAPCPEPLKRQAMETFPADSVWEFYGSTEGQFTVCSPQDWRSHPGSVGRARPDRRIEIDGNGQVWCHVPPFARFEYWRDPDKTAEAWTADGSAFTVGDLGRIDDDGFVYLDGRRDDLIITGGVNVYPAEVERALAAAPGVQEVAVFGLPDERWGQMVCAAVVGSTTPEQVQEHAATSLAGHKRPKRVFVVDDLPRTLTGKVRRTAIADELGLG
jgi:acyl-CoA synthetase (AMP-forming)/AMP-acid ligase II